ncbi:MAG: hypothetical protein FD167_5794, partial [bacterium]
IEQEVRKTLSLPIIDRLFPEEPAEEVKEAKETKKAPRPAASAS